MIELHYAIEEKFLKNLAKEIANEQEVQINVYAHEDMQWKTVRGIISKNPGKGGKQIGIYSRFGVYTETAVPLYLKIIEELEFEGTR